MSKIRYSSIPNVIVYIAFCIFIIKKIEIPILIKSHILVLLAMIYIIEFYYFCILSLGMPGGSKYNPLGFIELHIGYKNHGSKRKFYRLSAKIIQIGIKENKDISFATWTVDKESINRLFGNAALIYKPSITDKALCKTTKWGYEKFRKIRDTGYPIIKVVIKVRSLNREQVDFINKIAS